MRNLGGKRRGLSGTNPNPGDFPLGSIESRAAARASVEAVHHFAVLIGGRAPNGGCDPNFLANFAMLDNDRNGPVYERMDGETQREFQDRMMRVPNRKRINGTIVTFYTVERPDFQV